MANRNKRTDDKRFEILATDIYGSTNLLVTFEEGVCFDVSDSRAIVSLDQTYLEKLIEKKVNELVPKESIGFTIR